MWIRAPVVDVDTAVNGRRQLSTTAHNVYYVKYSALFFKNRNGNPGQISPLPINHSFQNH